MNYLILVFTPVFILLQGLKMNNDYFKNVYGAENEYLSNNPDYVIVETTLTEKDDTFHAIVKFLSERIRGSSWSIGLLPEYNNITVRMWDKEALVDFRKNFTQYIKS